MFPIICSIDASYLTNRFHVAVRLFSNRSQMTSTCGKNKKVAHEAQLSVSLMFLPHFDVLCDLLLNRRTATWNLFVLYNKKIEIYGKKYIFISNFATLTDTKIALTWSNVKMKRTDWLLCLAKNCDWFKVKIQKLQNKLESSAVVIYASVL